MACLWASLPASSATAAGRANFRALPGLVSGYTEASDRYVVYGDPRISLPAVRVVDTKSLKTRTFTLPADCRLYDNTPVTAAGTAVFSCQDRSVLMDVVTGALKPVERTPGVENWTALGRSWLGASVSCPTSVQAGGAADCATFRNIATGEIRTVQGTVGSFDLNTPNLARITPCSPFAERAPSPFDGASRWGRYIFLSGEPLTVGACGTGRKVKVGGPAATTSRGSLIGGWLTYYRYGGCTRMAYAYRLSVKRTFALKTPSVRGAHCVADAVHTKYAILVSLVASVEQNASIEDYTYRLLAARLPK